MATTMQREMTAEIEVASILESQRRLLTFADFDRMKEAGIFTEGERVELLDGAVLTMSTVGGRHVRVINRVAGVIARRDAPDMEVSVQNPLRIGDRAEFLPDIAVLRASPASNTVPTAEEAILVIEVADSSRSYDRNVKMPRYAAAGIPEMILVDLVDDRLISYADPRADGYRRILVAGRGEQIPSAAIPGLTFDVEQILGPKEA